MIEARKNHSEWHVAVEGLARGTWKTTRLGNTAKVKAAVTKETMQPLQTIFNELPTDSCFYTALCLMFYGTQLFKISTLNSGKIYMLRNTMYVITQSSPRCINTFQPNKRPLFRTRVNVVYWICVDYFPNINPCLLKLIICLFGGSATARQKTPDFTIIVAACALSAPSHRANRSVN